MKKIISLFCRNYESDRLVRNEIVPGAEWVVEGEGLATRKFDGTCCMVRGGKLYKRYDAKPGRKAPHGFEAAQDPDPVTGHHPGWLPVSVHDPSDKWHMEAFVEGLPDGTYELCGPKIGGSVGNPEGFPKHVLVAHGTEKLPDCPREFEAIKAYLSKTPIEGIVWHHADGRMVKIKTRDFGMPRCRFTQKIHRRSEQSMQKWAYYNDNDPRLCQWVKNLIKARILPDGEVDERPIQEVQPEDIRGFIQHHFFCGIGVWAYALRQAGWPDDRSVLTCSCPCQPFSSAGKKDGTADARHLWPEMFRIIREHRPPVVMGEQVASKHALAWLDLVLSDLEGAGYSAGAVDMCAAGVGAPHIRQRLWFVAENEGATWMRTKRWDYAGIDTGRGRETGVVADSECGAAERQRLKLAGA